MYLKKQNLNEEDVPSDCIFTQPKRGWSRYWYDLKRSIWVRFRNFWWGRDWRDKARSKRLTTKSGLSIYQAIVEDNNKRRANRYKYINIGPAVRKHLNDSASRHN